MIELHGGTLEIKSARGSGTTISVYLPIFAESAAPLAAAS
jgi:signal transduction histidine kinase